MLGSSSSSSSLSPTSTSSIPSATTITPTITTTHLSYTTITAYPASCDASWRAIPVCATSCLSSAAVTQANCGASDIICQCQNQYVIENVGTNCLIGECGFGGAIDVLNSVSAGMFHFLYFQSLLSSLKLLLILCFIKSAPVSSRDYILQQFQCSLRPRLQLHQRHQF